MARRQFYRFRIHAGNQFRPWQLGRQSNPQPKTELAEILAEPTEEPEGGTVSNNAEREAIAQSATFADRPNGTRKVIKDEAVQPAANLADPQGPEAIPTDSPVLEPRRKRGWSWSLVWLSVVLVCGGTGAMALVWLTMLPPPPNCQQISPLAADAERLYCAQQAAQSGELKQLIASVELVKHWSTEHPLYSSAQSSLAEWSRGLLAIANQKIGQNQLEAAVEIAQKIPPSSPLYQDAQAEISAWQQDWNQGEKIYGQAQAAIKAQKWQEAWKQSQALAGLTNEHWRQRVTALRQQIAVERLAWQQLQRAENLAQANTPEDLAAAIALLPKITPKTHAKTIAETKKVTWSKDLLKLAAAQLKQQQWESAIAIAEKVPAGVSVLAEAQDLIRLSRAYQAAALGKVPGKPLHEQLWSLVTALEVLRQIEPGRPLYKTAQAQRERWEMQRQDLINLQFAHTLANLGQVPALRLAIDQAKLVVPGRPQRLQAQTWIAHWQKEIQRVEDRPYLAQAQQLAKVGTVSSLRQAIAAASQIAQGRALRIDAQTAIATWKRQIQVVEDQPLLDQARTLANQGNLGKAIEVAGQIRSGRALYQEAQDAIYDWAAQIQIAEDRPVLNEAYGLASQGNLSQAINVAAQISYGRALYGEAQGAIANWSAERDAILAAREAEARQAAQDQQAAPAETPAETPAEAPATDDPESDSDPSGAAEPTYSGEPEPPTDSAPSE
ncbi:hypothetical protein [Trichocoleus sp. FACHB-262]|uniref:hypothetical protein n=1 Tax=Trichocoleus sp. FACHB-262 TaxID=2692869 RepID=UPI001683D65B|nr:hypothetical protein [Trichocoleus sp. FACHB-262]MBD2123384.1 hypothetical protein [Trichocoleus sp. FACHB-262]